MELAKGRYLRKDPPDPTESPALYQCCKQMNLSLPVSLREGGAAGFLRPFPESKGWQSANKFRKSQIRKFSDLTKFVWFADLPQMCHSANMRFAHLFFFVMWFADLKLLQVCENILYLLTYIAYSALIQLWTCKKPLQRWHLGLF